MFNSTSVRKAGVTSVLAIALIAGSAAAAFAYTDHTTVANAGVKNVADGVCIGAAWSTSSYAYTQSSTSSGCNYIGVRAYVVSGGTGYYSSWSFNYSPVLNTRVEVGPFSTVTSGYHRMDA